MSGPAESFYTSSHTQSTPNVSSPGAPPPPPPKPAGHVASNDPSRSGTPLSYAVQQQQPPLPPQPVQYNTSPPPPPVPPGPFSSQPGQGYSPAPQQYQQSQQPSQPPTVPPPSHAERWLPSAPDLTAHTIPDLTSLLSDQKLIAALAQTHPSYASSLEPLLSQLKQNVALAHQLQQTEAKLRSERDKTAQLMLNHTSLQQQWRRKQSEMDDALSPWQPRAMYQRLVASIAEQEAVLRAIHDSFLDGDGVDDEFGARGDGKASDREVAEWIRRIREGTTTLEKRRELKNRWDEGRVGGFR